jgi:hypothetical protein
MADPNNPPYDPQISDRELAAINKALPAGSTELPGKVSQVIKDLACQVNNIRLSARKRLDYRSVLKTMIAIYPEAADVAVQGLSPHGSYGTDHSLPSSNNPITVINEVKQEVKQEFKQLPKVKEVKAPSF